MKPRILWIEDSARLELRNLLGPIYFSGNYDFTLAEDVTTAINFIQSKQFDGIIVDMRLPPGNDPNWQRRYQRNGMDKVQAQLGLHLLNWLLGGDRSIQKTPPPDWVRPERVAVFTVEGQREIQEALTKLQITAVQQKMVGARDTALVELIERLISHSSPGAV